MNPETHIRFLIANLGSEVLRGLTLYERAGEEELGRSLARSLDICRRLRSLPLSDSAAGEVAIIEEELRAMQRGEFHDGKESWEKYFNPFALRITAGLVA